MSGGAAELQQDPSAHVGQRVVLVGTARDAQAGAVVMLGDGTPVFIAGLRGWDDAWDRKRIRVTGTLRDRSLAPEPEVDEKGQQSPGMEGDALVIDEATWEEVA